MLPILEIPDENYHFQVGYAIFSSNKRAGEDLLFSEGTQKARINAGAYDELFSERTSAQNDAVGINTGSYVFDGRVHASITDVMHIPSALGILLGKLIHPSVGVMVIFGRLFSLIFYAVSVYLIIKHIKYGKWVLLFVSTLPMMIHQAASLSYDPVNTVAIFAWIAFIINLFSQKSILTKKQLAVGALLGIFLLLTKANNVLLLVLILALPSRLVLEAKPLRVLRESRHWRIIKYTAVLLAVITVTLGAIFMSQKILAGQEFKPMRLLYVLLNTFISGDLLLIDVTTIGVFGQFGTFQYHLPIWLILSSVSVFTITMLWEKLPEASRRFAVISVAAFLGSVLVASVGMYYAWAMQPNRLGPGADVTDGIQGRYFTPLLILLFPAFAYIQKYFKISSKNRSSVPVLTVSTSIVLLLAFIFQTWWYFWR